MSHPPAMLLAAGPFAKQYVLDELTRQEALCREIRATPEDPGTAAGEAEARGDYLVASVYVKMLAGRTVEQARAETEHWGSNARIVLRQSPLFSMPEVTAEDLAAALQREIRVALDGAHYLEAMVYRGLLIFWEKHLALVCSQQSN